MLTQTLIHVAVLAYFSVPSGHGINIGFHVGQKTAAKVEEKVVLRESPLSEKCGLDLEAVTRPDKEIIALRLSVSGLQSALALGEQIKKQTPEKPLVADRWKGRFAVTWDEENGFFFNGKHYPPSERLPERLWNQIAQPLDSRIEPRYSPRVINYYDLPDFMPALNCEP